MPCVQPNNCSGPNDPTQQADDQRGATTSGGAGGYGAGRAEGQDTTDHPWGPPPPYSPTDPFGPPMEAVFGPPPPYSPTDPRESDEGRRHRGRPRHPRGPPSPREPSGPGSDPRWSDLVYSFPRINDPQAKEDLNAVMSFFVKLRKPHHGRRHGMFTVTIDGIQFRIEVWENNLENIEKALETHILDLLAGFSANLDAGFTDLTVKFVTESDGETSGDVGMKIHGERLSALGIKR
ncbi:hypothetical protein, conserved [Eimeria brunetti]|uniref:Uncharacterized protein n=1 Tax=Eimeria brunetti TaxID=51314 RepID=U6M242_9EIME|nr:hypothetical protein, conserved [Eimeria brunetti]